VAPSSHVDVHGTPVTVLTAPVKSELITYPNPGSGGTRFPARDEGRQTPTLATR
jgi:hypothetical protein